MRILLAFFGLMILPAWGQITWKKVWSSPASGSIGSYYNGYHDIHYDAYTNRTWIYSTDTTGGADSIYSSRLHYFNANNNADTLIGSNNQPSAGGCLGSTSTWPYSSHPVGQIWVDAVRHRLWIMEGVGCTFIPPEQWYYQFDSGLNGHTNWVRVHPPHLPTKTYPTGPNGVKTSTLGGLFNNASVVHDTDHDAFLLFGYDNGNNSHSMQVYCDTSVNPTPGTLTAAQKSVGCANADDWTDITSQTKCAAGSTCITAGGVGWIPPGYYYPNLEYDSVHHQVIQFGGLQGASTVKNDTWIFDMVTKTWRNMRPASPPANSSANNENGRIAHAFNTRDGKYYYHLTAHVPNVNNPLSRPPEDWVYDPVANTWTQLGVGQGPQLLETMTYDAQVNALVAWGLHVEADGIFGASGTAEIWMGTFGVPTAPNITSASPLPQGSQSSTYSYSFSASGSTPITWSVESGTLPTGLSLSSGGSLSGVPAAAGTYTFSIRASNSAGSDGPQSFSLTVGPPSVIVGPSITSATTLPQATQNTAYSFNLAATGSTPLTWSVASGSLPTGITLGTTGALAGTPASAGTYVFVVQASNSAGSASQSVTLAIVSSSGPTGLSVPLTVQEALYPGSVPGVARTSEPFCQGVPLADSAGITGTSSLGLSGASAGQFRVLGSWPSGNAKWVEVCGTLASFSAGGTSVVTLNGSGSGNFGGSNLATDNGATITVSTGAATFTIRKAKFNVVDQAVVGTKIVVASGASQGLVVTGPSPTAAYPGNVTCSGGNCTTIYSSANDAGSTCAIEKNGPVVAVLKCTGSHVDASGHSYMRFTLREHFYKGRTNVKLTSSLRNADYGTSNTFATAYKGHEAYELRITPNIQGTLKYTVANHTDAPTTGTMSGTDSVYLYQGESQSMKWQEWCGSGCVAYTSDTGYSIVKNGSTLLSGTNTQYPQGWADVQDGNGTGVEIGVYQLSAYWPKSLEFNGGGSDVRIGIWARQNSRPYYQEWPQHSTYDLYLNFHAAPASPANDFLAFQHYLVARAAYTYYNSTAVFPYNMIDPATEDAYYTSAGATANPNTISTSRACCGQDFGTSNGQWPLSIFRYYYWHTGGGGNQTEFRWSYLMNFITRGWTGRWLQASHFYRFLADSAFPRSDGFNWRDRPHLGQANAELDGFGFPAAASANNNLATGHANWLDTEHGHWYGLPDYYFLTGDETIKDAILDGPKDQLLNMDSYQAGAFGGEWNSRAIGVELMGAARLSKFLAAVGDPDATGVLTQAVSDYMAQVNSQLCVSGYPSGCSFGPIEPDGSWLTQGISRTRGLHYGGTNSYLNPWCQDNNRHVRGAAVFMANNLIQGILELRDAKGPGWSEYLNSLDLAYGMSRWALNEMYVDDGSGRWDTNGYRYYIALDRPGNCSDTTGVQDSHTTAQPQQTVTFAFLPKYLVDGDVSWANKFKINIQRDQAAIGTITSDFNSNLIQHMIGIMQNPTAPKLNAVPLTAFADNGGGSYTISWTVPTGTQSYRIKWGPKQIVDWIGFNPITNSFTGDPVNTMNWFAATNVAVLPVPAAPGSVQSLTINTGVSNLKAANFSVKAYGGSTGGGGGTKSCDLNLDGIVNVSDVQIAVNQTVGSAPCTTADLSGNGTCTVVDVQRLSNAALGMGCRLGP